MIIVDKSLECLAQLPDCAGVYLFYQNQGSVPVYIGKSINIRQRVKSHFQNAKRDRKEQRLIEKTCFIDYRETVGELGALLLEAQLVKTLMPMLNRRLRKQKYLYSFTLVEQQGFLQPKLQQLNLNNMSFRQDYFGLFRNQRIAKQTLEKIIAEQKLCQKMLGFEKTNKACFNYQLKRCAGACVGEVSAKQHNQQLQQALSKYQQRQWPYDGMIVIRENNDTLQALHYINHWHYLGTREIALDADIPNEAPEQQGSFSLDDYKIICGGLRRAEADMILQF